MVYIVTDFHRVSNDPAIELSTSFYFLAKSFFHFMRFSIDYFMAIASISTFTSLGKRATCTAARAG